MLLIEKGDETLTEMETSIIRTSPNLHKQSKRSGGFKRVINTLNFYFVQQEIPGVGT